MFTGGSLIVGAAARTDLVDAERTVEFARAQYPSLHRLAGLPDATAVWPTHGAGSFFSASPGAARASMIGTEKSYFDRLAEVNRRDPDVLAVPPPLAPLDPANVRALITSDGHVVDVRPVADYAAKKHPRLGVDTAAGAVRHVAWLVAASRHAGYGCD